MAETTAVTALMRYVPLPSKAEITVRNWRGGSVRAGAPPSPAVPGGPGPAMTSPRPPPRSGSRSRPRVRALYNKESRRHHVALDLAL